jgi:hypothetical protein
MDISETLSIVATGKPKTSRHGYGDDAIVWLSAVERFENSCSKAGFHLQRYCTEIAMLTAGPIQVKGSPGIYRSDDSKTAQIGPVLAYNQFGKVFVELYEDLTEKIEIEHKKGAYVWLNLEKISWNAAGVES